MSMTMLLGLAAICLLGIWLHREVTSPRAIHWRETRLSAMKVHRAAGLVLQHETPGLVWATCGYAIYRSRRGGSFERVHVLRVRVGPAWAGYFRSFRRHFGYHDLVEVLPLREDLLIAFAGGDVHRIDLQQRRSVRTHRLRYFGRREGRGLMAHGVTTDDVGSAYFAEYPTRGSNSIAVWRSDDEGRSWGMCAEFPTGYVRHIHAVQFDEVERGVWIASGDLSRESRIGVSRDRGATFSWIGENSQYFRTCGLLCFEDTVVWGTDADDDGPPNTTMVFDRVTGQTTPGTLLPSQTFFAQAIDDRTGLLGLAQTRAAVWVVDLRGVAIPWLEWDVPERRTSRLPGVRLARGRPSEPDSVHVNPIRTRTDQAAVYRVPTVALPRPATEARETLGDVASSSSLS
jgi:hypothetical protein